MPELPAVENYKNYFKVTVLHKKITAVKVNNAKILKHPSIQAFRDQLKDRSFEIIKRHGKHLFVLLDNSKWIVLHFGMSGDVKYYQDQAKEPKYSRIVFSFENGYHLALISQRMLGSVFLTKDIESVEKNLGPDALSIKKKQFSNLIKKSRGMLKYTLMDQKKISGIGNVYSDEILFQSRLHPQTTAKNLEEREIDVLYKTMIRVLKQAVDDQADRKKFPQSWLIAHRKEGASCPRCKGKVVMIKVSGRSTYFCPSCQKKE